MSFWPACVLDGGSNTRCILVLAVLLSFLSLRFNRKSTLRRISVLPNFVTLSYVKNIVVTYDSLWICNLLNKWIKMAACILFIEVLRENEDKDLHREPVFRDRSQVLDMLTDSELIGWYWFQWRVILQLTDDMKDYIQPKTLRSYAIPAHIQVILLIWLKRGNSKWSCTYKASHQPNSYKY